jgi:hypothetical protein
MDGLFRRQENRKQRTKLKELQVCTVQEQISAHQVEYCRH